MIKAICEEEKSQLSGPKEENPAHLDNKPITAHRLVTAIELIGFLQGVSRGALLQASILIVSYSVVFVAAMPPFPILPHLSSLFVLRSSRQPSNLPPGLAGITTLRHCPPSQLLWHLKHTNGSILHSSFSCYSCVISKRLVTHYLQSLFQSCLHCWNIFCALSLLQLCWQRLGWPRQEQNMKYTRLGHGVTPPQAWCISPWIQRTACTDVIASLLYGCDAAAFLCSHWELWFMAAKKQPFQLLCKPYCSAPSCVDASICRLFTCL